MRKYKNVKLTFLQAQQTRTDKSQDNFKILKKFQIQFVAFADPIRAQNAYLIPRTLPRKLLSRQSTNTNAAPALGVRSCARSNAKD